MTFTSRSKFNSPENRYMKMFVSISSSLGSSFSTNSGVDFHHSEFHRRLLKYQWYYITLRDSQCIGRQSIPIFHPEPKVDTMKIYESLSKDLAYMKSKLESIRKRKRRKDRIIFRYRTNISTNDLYEMQATIRRLRKEYRLSRNFLRSRHRATNLPPSKAIRDGEREVN